MAGSGGSGGSGGVSQLRVLCRQNTTFCFWRPIGSPGGPEGCPRTPQGCPGAPRAAQGRPRGTPARGKQLYIQTHVSFSAPGRFEHRFEELINAICLIFPCGSFSDFQDVVTKSTFEHRLLTQLWVIFGSSQNDARLVRKSFPHPVGVFCSLKTAYNVTICFFTF